MQSSILGMYPIAFWGVFALSIIVLWIIYSLWKNIRQQRRYRNDMCGKLLCEFLTPGVGSETIACNVWQGQARKIEPTSRLGFITDRFIKAPKGHESSIDIYFVLDDHCWPHPYPEGEKPEKQIMVMKTHYLKGDPMPKIARRPQDWTPERYANATAALIKMALNEKALQVFSSEVAGVWGKIENMIDYLKQIPQVRMLEFVIIIVLLIGLWITFTTRGAVMDMKPYIIPGG